MAGLKPTLRILPPDLPNDARWNMAVDEALLEAGTAAVPTARFYLWENPSVSVGYFQDPRAALRVLDGRFEGCRVVRRPTGGGVVAHGEDLTIALIVPEALAGLPAGVTDSYRAIHSVYLEALKPFFGGLGFSGSSAGFRPRSERVCFEEPTAFDLERQGRKAAGSSQRRRGGVLLHHTSLALVFESTEQRTDAVRAIARGLGLRFGLDEVEAGLSPEEIQRAQVLMNGKYLEPRNTVCADFVLTGGGAGNKIF
ncbi:MAG: hypothetical protein HQL11_00570 [Candidatus Omnitrophica bacterium]|nr:hypothetical protein [Candidatus Omnitrophota bacterium]